MAISANYSTPVQVNGFSCNNCTDVGYAKKHIDPARPQSGPYDINARDDPSRTVSNAVTFAGNLSGLNTDIGRSPASDLGRQLDISA